MAATFFFTRVGPPPTAANMAVQENGYLPTVSPGARKASPVGKDVRCEKARKKSPLRWTLGLVVRYVWPFHPIFQRRFRRLFSDLIQSGFGRGKKRSHELIFDKFQVMYLVYPSHALFTMPITPRRVERDLSQGLQALLDRAFACGALCDPLL